jgi:ribosomal protein RSM22 (predicted rRNA methylase)
MAAYRSGEVPRAPVMASGKDAAAYAAYRMPATAAATALALQETRLSLRDWAPATLLDFGAGTGSVAWAAAGGLPSIQAMTLLEQSPDAIGLGRAILRTAKSPVLQAATWRSWRLPDRDGPAQADDLPVVDLATASYVLGELTEPQRAAIVALMTRQAPAIVLVEPGTPAGHRRILAARAQLLGAGYVVAAPCPHQLRCPLDTEGDWCHFGARLPRSALHRQVKGAELAYEDEKFSYVAAVRPAPLGPQGAELAVPNGRIVRRPQQRKGIVLLDLCVRDGQSQRELVSKRQGDAYREARKLSWGQRFG